MRADQGFRHIDQTLKRRGRGGGGGGGGSGGGWGRGKKSTADVKGERELKQLRSGIDQRGDTHLE